MGKIDMPAVTIILPSYNGSKYIRESINSIQEQTFTDWELIIVDDCSEDNTLEIAKKYEGKDNRIRVIHNETNKKLPTALNIGFKHATGKYLTWTSDDNIYLPNALAIMVKRLEQLNVPMVCADEYLIDEFGNTKTDVILKYDGQLRRCNTIGACFLYRREILDSIGDYDTGLFCIEDYDYWLRIKKRYGYIERIDQILYKYRSHNTSLSFTKKEKVRTALIKLRKKHLDFILEEYKGEKELLFAFYYDLLERQELDKELKERIQNYLPELKNDMLGKKGKYIILGAGRYGEKAFKAVEEEVTFFADNDETKVGKSKCGKQILSFEKMICLSKKYDIMIAIYCDNVYQLIHQLSKNGIERYCTLQTYVDEKRG